MLNFDPYDPTDPQDLPLGVKVELLIVRGEAVRKVRTIETPLYMIGTAVDCDLVLGDPQFSPYHAYLHTRGEGTSFRHMGRSPEVTVNGRVFRWGEVLDGDRIRMGPYEFHIRVRRLPKGEAHKKELGITENTGQSAGQMSMPYQGNCHLESESWYAAWTVPNPGVPNKIAHRWQNMHPLLRRSVGSG